MNPFKQFNNKILPLLNLLWNKVDGMDRMRGDSFISVNRAGGGVALSLNIPALRKGLTRSTSGDGITHKAFPMVDAGSGSAISCYLDTDLTGTVITVNCSISNGAALNSASPRLKTGDLILIASVGGEWHCLTVFQTTDPCTCTSP